MHGIADVSHCIASFPVTVQYRRLLLLVSLSYIPQVSPHSSKKHLVDEITSFVVYSETAAAAAGGAGDDPAGDEGDDQAPEEPAAGQPDEEVDPEEVYFKIYITFEEKSFTLVVSTLDTIARIKRTIFAQEGFVVDRQRLSFSEHPDLLNYETVKHYGIEDGDLLILSLVDPTGLRGGAKRGLPNDVIPPKEVLLAELHGILTFYEGFVEAETRAELARLDSGFRSFAVLDGFTADVLGTFNERVIQWGANLTDKRLAEILTPLLTPLYARLTSRRTMIEQSMMLLKVQVQLCLVRLLVSDAGQADFRGFRALLAEKLNYRRGVEAAAVPPAAPVA